MQNHAKYERVNCGTFTLDIRVPNVTKGEARTIYRYYQRMYWLTGNRDYRMEVKKGAHPLTLEPIRYLYVKAYNKPGVLGFFKAFISN